MSAHILKTVLITVLLGGCVLAKPSKCQYGIDGYSCATKPDSSYTTAEQDSVDNNTDNLVTEVITPDTQLETTDSKPKPSTCPQYESQVEFLANSGTWKTCYWNKIETKHNLTFDQTVDLEGECVAFAHEDNKYKLYVKTVVAAETKFSAIQFDSNIVVECEK